MAGPGPGSERTQWKPGQSGNPGGRTKGIVAYIKEHTRNGEELIDAVLTVLRDKRNSGLTKLKAFELLAERLWGKPYTELQQATENVPTHILILNFFKILDNLQINESLRPQLREAIRTAIQTLADGKLLQNQGQEQTTPNTPIEPNPTTDLPGNQTLPSTEPTNS